MDFTAIDFETATGRRDSACSVAVLTVKDGEIKDSFYTLIRPPGNHYDWRNIEIHGIRPEQTEEAGDFAAIWPELSAYLEGRDVIAHNAPFDMGVLKACLYRYDLDWPRFFYADTVRLARCAWPDLYNHKLNTVADYLGVSFRHHDALEDARACAEIPLNAGDRKEPFTDLLNRFGVPRVPF